MASTKKPSLSLTKVRESLIMPNVKAAIARLETGEGIAFSSYAVAGLPDPTAYSGRLVVCSNGASGSPCLAYSNGTNWLRIALGAAVSAT